MMNLLLVGIGGALGSISRYLLGGVVQSFSPNASFPWGTVFVNVTGCFAIGLLAQLAESRGAFSDATRTFLFIGVLGGYTTFSTFGNETISLLRLGESGAAFANVAVQVVAGLAAVWIGRDVALAIWR